MKVDMSSSTAALVEPGLASRIWAGSGCHNMGQFSWGCRTTNYHQLLLCTPIVPSCVKEISVIAIADIATAVHVPVAAGRLFLERRMICAGVGANTHTAEAQEVTPLSLWCSSTTQTCCSDSQTEACGEVRRPDILSPATPRSIPRTTAWLVRPSPRHGAGQSSDHRRC